MIYDVGIVGAGPIGLATAAELSRRGRSVVQFDKGCIGKTVEWFPRGMRFYSSPRFLELLDFPLPSDGEKPTREEYLAYLRSFVRQFGLKVNMYETVNSITGSVGDYRLQTTKRGGETAGYRAKTIVLAVGTNEFPRKLDVPGEDLPHVCHYFDEPHRYFGRSVAVVGARNSACDAAILLSRIGCDVTLIHRGEGITKSYLKYWIYPEITGLIRKGTIKAHFNSTLTRIDPAGVELDGPETSCRVDCDFVLLLVGYHPDYRLLDQLGVRTEGPTRQPAVDEATFESNVAGVYCCGTLIAGDQNPYRVFIENAQHHPGVVADAVEARLGQ